MHLDVKSAADPMVFVRMNMIMESFTNVKMETNVFMVMEVSLTIHSLTRLTEQISS